MQQPDRTGRAAELLYSGVEDAENKVSTPPLNINELHPRPSLIPGVPYPCNDREEEMMDRTWEHCNRYWMRILEKLYQKNEDDRRISAFRDEIERIRGELDL